MTGGAQQALRRTMEIYSNTTRFALACNQSNKIIEPIQSRCAVLRYAKLTDSQILKRLIEICDAENVSCQVCDVIYMFYVTNLLIYARCLETMTVWRHSYSQPMEICDRLSTICKQLTMVSNSSTAKMSSKCVTSHTLLSFTTLLKIVAPEIPNKH
jgi:hypothetical protein